MKTHIPEPNELVKLFNEYFPEPVIGDLPGYEQALQAHINTMLVRERRSGFVVGFAAGGGELEKLETAWELYEALEKDQLNALQSRRNDEQL